MHSVEKEKNFPAKNNFRQNNYLLIYILKTLLSRNFFGKNACAHVSQCGNFCDLVCRTYFWQKFRESNVFTEEITKELI